jgi:hypothetical protein
MPGTFDAYNPDGNGETAAALCFVIKSATFSLPLTMFLVAL